jgi:hypothetical protein
MFGTTGSLLIGYPRFLLLQRPQIIWSAAPRPRWENRTSVGVLPSYPDVRSDEGGLTTEGVVLYAEPGYWEGVILTSTYGIDREVFTRKCKAAKDLVIGLCCLHTRNSLSARLIPSGVSRAGKQLTTPPQGGEWVTPVLSTGIPKA